MAAEEAAVEEMRAELEAEAVVEETRAELEAEAARAVEAGLLQVICNCLGSLRLRFTMVLRFSPVKLE